VIEAWTYFQSVATLFLGSGAMSGTKTFFQKFSLDNSNTGHHSLVTLLDRILSNYMQFSILAQLLASNLYFMPIG
jgi:hypothetical protein